VRISASFARVIAVPQRVGRRYFARRVIYPQELPSIMRKHIYTGMMGSVYFTLTSGIFFVYFGTAIGMSRFQWGVMGGVSSFVLAFQLVAASLTQRLGRRKVLWFWFAVACRGIRFLGILFSLWLWQAGYMDATPPERKTFSAMVVFTVAALIGFLDLSIHGTIPEPPMVMSGRQRFVDHLLVPIRDRAFRPWLTFNAFWTFGMTLGGSLAILYFVEDLGIKKHFLGGMMVLTALPIMGGILTASRSGRLVDQIGPKRVLYWGHLFWAFLPVFWLVASPNTALLLLGLAGILGGTASTAAITAAIKLVTRLPRPSDRAMYVAVSSCVGSLAGGLGILTAGTVLRVLGDWQTTFLGCTFAAFHVLFVASLCLRLGSALLLIRRLREPEVEMEAG